MWIRMLTKSSGPEGHRNVDEVWDAPTAEATALIQGRHAERVDAPARAPVETADRSTEGQETADRPGARPGVKPAAEGAGKKGKGRPGVKPAAEGADDPPAGDSPDA